MPRPPSEPPRGRLVDAFQDELAADLADLEACARLGRTPPASAGYLIRLNRSHLVVTKPAVTGRELLWLARLLPAERYCLQAQFIDRGLEPLPLDANIDLRMPGLQRFEAVMCEPQPVAP